MFFCLIRWVLWLRRYTIWVFGLVVALLLGRWVLERLFGFLITILLSLFLGFAIEPLVDRLARHGWRRGAATLLVYAVIAIIVTGFIVLVGSLVVSQTTGLVKSGPDGLAQISQWLKDHYDVNLPTSSAEISKRISAAGPTIAGGALGFATGLLGLIFQLFTVALLGFFFATEGPRFRRACALGSHLPASWKSCGSGTWRSRRRPASCTPGSSSRQRRRPRTGRSSPSSGCPTR